MVAESTTCAACGLPPFKSKSTGKNLPLKRCSRCQQVWYHNVQCQKNHFPIHKNTCFRQIQNEKKHDGTVRKDDESLKQNIPCATSPVANASLGQSQAKFQVETRHERGRCLVAREQIQKHERISFQNEKEGWEPLVPPVLLEHNRSNRCAWCFYALSTRHHHNHFTFSIGNDYKSSAMTKGNIQSPYQLLFCSTQCRERAQRNCLEQEEKVIHQLYIQKRGPPRLFATAILLYRIYVHLANSSSQGTTAEEVEVRKLQCHIPTISPPPTPEGLTIASDDDDNDAQDHHVRAVTATVTAIIMMQLSLNHDKHKNIALPNMTDMKEMLNRIKLNGFSIADGESVALGIGLYPSIPSYMNHSCQPNAIQTFLYGQDHQPPSLFVTTCSNIQPGQEICISYIDNSCPYHLRRPRLQHNYFFYCHCDACSQEEGNPRSKSVGRWMDAIERGMAEKVPTVNVMKELQEQYSHAKQLCLMDSWYVQEAGDRLVQAILDQLGNAQNVQEQETLASRALELLQELLSTKPSSGSSSSSFLIRKNLQRFKAAKLVLFLYLDTRLAIEWLQESLSFFAPYYSKKHELIATLQATLQEAQL